MTRGKGEDEADNGILGSSPRSFEEITDEAMVLSSPQQSPRSPRPLALLVSELAPRSTCSEVRCAHLVRPQQVLPPRESLKCNLGFCGCSWDGTGHRWPLMTWVTGHQVPLTPCPQQIARMEPGCPEQERLGGRRRDEAFRGLGRGSAIEGLGAKAFQLHNKPSPAPSLDH